MIRVTILRARNAIFVDMFRLLFIAITILILCDYNCSYYWHSDCQP